MPTSREERDKLAKDELELLLTDLFRQYLTLLKCRDDYSVEMVLPEFLSEAADRVIKAEYKQIREGDIYWTREQLSAPDWSAKYYKRFVDEPIES